MVTLRVGAVLFFLVTACEKSPASTPPPDAVKPSAVGTPAASAPAATTTALSPASAALWVGTYNGTWAAGGATVSYVVTVKKAPGDGYQVDVEADGTQTMTRIAAEGRMPPPGSGEGAVMSVHFVACKPDDMFKCRGYAKGDRLFRIRIVPDAHLLAFDKMIAPDDKTKEIPLQKK